MKKLLLILLLGCYGLSAQNTITNRQLIQKDHPINSTGAVDTAGISNGGILRYDPVTGKHRFWDAISSTWKTPVWQGSIPAAPVTSVFGRTGAVIAQIGDYTAAQVSAWAITGTTTITNPNITGDPYFNGAVVVGGSGAITAGSVFEVRGASTTDNFFRLTNNVGTARFIASSAGVWQANSAVQNTYIWASTFTSTVDGTYINRISGTNTHSGTSGRTNYINLNQANLSTGATNQSMFANSNTGTFTTNHTGAILYGYDWNPTLAGSQTPTHLAFRAVTGDVLIGNTTITPGSILDVQSVSKTFNVPRVTSRASVTSVTSSAIDYDAATGLFEFYEAGNWRNPVWLDKAQTLTNKTFTAPIFDASSVVGDTWIATNTTGSGSWQALTASNGVTKIGNNFALGSPLTGNTSIDCGFNTFELIDPFFEISGNGAMNADFTNGTADGQINANRNSINLYQAPSGTGKEGTVTVSAGEVSIASGDESNTNKATLLIKQGAGASKFTDTNGSSQGLLYGADYSANYTARSLVDKGYVDGLVGGAGDVVGPASSTDNAIARFDLATGKLIQNSSLLLDDSGNLNKTGQLDINIDELAINISTGGSATIDLDTDQLLIEGGGAGDLVWSKTDVNVNNSLSSAHGIATDVDANDLILSAGSGYTVSGDGDGGDVQIVSGAKRAAGAGVEGNIVLNSQAGQIAIPSGANDSQGRATLVAGTITVNNTKVTSTCNIYLTSQVDGGTPGWVRVSARSAGTSFTITSSSGTDTSEIAWLIIEQN